MKEVKIYTIVSDQLSPPITGESFCTDMVRHSDYAELEAKCAAMVAENAELKSALNDILQPDAAVLERNHRVRALDAMETPATDEFLAEVRASARNEGINYAASRLAAAFNHGFLDKPVSEVLDVTRMILSAKEDLSNDPLPADDGLSGEYAEKAIEEWAAQLRKGVQS
ncbi:hypothetical protein ACNTN3_004281 [Salmonella enterica]|uniref:Eae protein n=2 Tax=Salmonella enterica TaxID=28901 RepID=A0A5V4BC12_SALER|nr:hypothetical protein [Salmonella enterica]EBK1855220.1 hypothetical protein [Salmonella enterica subsp. enterica serovar Give]ECU5973547.1 hypothetical protein [Salmonella enterica subsp. enterica serovar Gaminara]EEG5868821.1 hypothetical protein [Salmonella enterica subsp. enterica]QVB88310.1 hypothetical protein JYM95_16745 [Salmonella enterica subsp. enterica serovar Give var. 15 str. CFSAN004343]EAP0062164.1 hypothetical protein [Salmonella enterica]